VLSTEFIAAKLIIFNLRTSFDLIPCGNYGVLIDLLVTASYMSHLSCSGSLPCVGTLCRWESVQSGSKSLPTSCNVSLLFFFSYFMKKLGGSGSEK
jgi:hypothetical protein